jgi:hypothetical protein
MLMTIAAFALLAVGLGVLLVATQRVRALGVMLIVCGAVMLGLELRALDRERAQLRTLIADRDSLVEQYCRSLAFTLVSEVNEYRALTEDGVGPEAHYLRRFYLRSLSERRQVARMCVADGNNEKWFTCIPQELNEQTLDRIERLATAIKERKPWPCDEGVSDTKR